MAPTRFSSGLSLWSFSFRPPMGYSACLYRRVSYPTGMPACQPSLPNAERNLRNRPEVRVTRSTAKSADRYNAVIHGKSHHSQALSRRESPYSAVDQVGSCFPSRPTGLGGKSNGVTSGTVDSIALTALADPPYLDRLWITLVRRRRELIPLKRAAHLSIRGAWYARPRCLRSFAARDTYFL